jgi:hypothetical protein
MSLPPSLIESLSLSRRGSADKNLGSLEDGLSLSISHRSAPAFDELPPQTPTDSEGPLSPDDLDDGLVLSWSHFPVVSEQGSFEENRAEDGEGSVAV